MYYTRDNQDHSITIRLAEDEDHRALRRLAQLDSAAIPEGQILVASAGGEIKAAVSVASGEAIADPFQATSGIVGMLTLRASQLRGNARSSPARRLLAALARPGRSGSAPQPAGTLKALEQRR